MYFCHQCHQSSDRCTEENLCTLCGSGFIEQMQQPTNYQFGSPRQVSGVAGPMLLSQLMDNLRNADLDEQERDERRSLRRGIFDRTFIHGSSATRARRENILNLLTDLQRSLHEMSVLVQQRGQAQESTVHAAPAWIMDVLPRRLFSEVVPFCFLM